ncbi:MAG TPA: addiction module protein [Pyrinomonadaceae bacterium]|nr:addiction module protein [Pyrinomonadaceae bacterium]
MSHKIPFPPPGFDQLSIEEQIDYAGDLWDHVISEPERVPTPEWHKQILAERLARNRSSGDEGMPWEEFEKKLEQELNRS